MADALEKAAAELLARAAKARDAAYAPYSRFAVGAAVRTASGKIYTGCNIENASYSLTICAERVAIFKAVAAGDTQIVALALVADSPAPPRPCGACRQVLAEFAKTADVIMGNTQGQHERRTIAQLFPEAFALDPPP
jgi:cytidine deaminase